MGTDTSIPFVTQTDCTFKSIRAETKKIANVFFKEIAGFRMLDEGCLQEFWGESQFSMGYGCIFRVIEHGWFDFEKTRSGFQICALGSPDEYFIPSTNECLNILSWVEPSIEIVSATPDPHSM